MSQLALNGGSPVRTRPFPGWPVWDGQELEAVKDVIESGRWGMAQGDRVAALERRFAEFQQARHGIACTSGTVALKVALQAAGLPAGAEVVVPAYTFVASATAVLEANLVPVFADIDPDTYNLDPRSVEAALTPNTRAIMPVHLAGLPADLDALRGIAERHRLTIIEDACQAWGSEHHGRKVGAIGAAGAFSFQSSKHITAGEGGMLVSDDDELAIRLRSVVNCGRKQDGDWHLHVRLGGNYRLSELQAAVILVQLERFPEMHRRRQENARFLRERLGKIEGLRPLAVPDYVTAVSCHMLILRYDCAAWEGLSRDRLIAALKAEGLKLLHGGYGLPINRQPLFLEKETGPFDRIRSHQYRGRVIDYGAQFHCPVAERACAGEALWLLQSLLLAEREELEDVVRIFAKVREHYRELL